MSESQRPFIYIAALRRTGSTLLSEALTALPYSMIFRETHLGENIFSAKKDDAALLRSYGIRLRRFSAEEMRWAVVYRRLSSLGIGGDYGVRTFKRKLLARLSPHVQQFGVKEVTHQGWRHFARHFPTIKIILIARDPRDIYLSMQRKWRNGTLNWKRPFNPETVAGYLNWQASFQREMAHTHDCLKVRYEELCRTPEEQLASIMTFVNSPLPSVGKIGRFVGNQPSRLDEAAIHGGQITSHRIFGWRKLKDASLLKEIGQFEKLMAGYMEFWGYE